MKTIHLAFLHERSTKNTERYTEQPIKVGDFVIGKLSVQRRHLGEQIPDVITVQLDFQDE